MKAITHASACLPGAPLDVVVGALHVSGANEAIIPETVAASRTINLAIAAAGDITGWRTMTALANAFCDRRFVPLSMGKRFSL